MRLLRLPALVACAWLAGCASLPPRGVRVRLLVDNLYADDIADLLVGLAAHSGVQVRVFNPLPARGGPVATRLLRSAHEFERVNHRMHNKLFADGAI